MDATRLFFGVMYRIGFTPWDGHPTPARLTELVEGTGALPKGRALDIGCGTGDTSIYLAKHGWNVTGIDFVEKALGRALAKSRAAGVSVRFERADATRLRASGIDGSFPLLIDNGCFHGLSDEARDAYVREVSAVAAPGAHLLLMAFPVSKRRPGPRGIDAPEVERRFSPGWRIVASGSEPTVSAMHPRWGSIRFYDLQRDAG
jgi:cyclopropane fatty-acyl-phospholipid synthase-like methyltransferase